MWLSFAGIFYSGNKIVTQDPTRIIMTALWACAMLYTALFIATVTHSYIYKYKLINGPDMLYQKHIITTPYMKDNVAPYGPYFRDYPLVPETMPEAIEILKDGEIDALVFDYNIIKAFASED
jgi:hypothetical protein